MSVVNNIIKIGFLNFKGQCILNEARQLQAEDFLKKYDLDILQCQEIQRNNDTFSQCNYIQANYSIISNNNVTTYGTASLVINNYSISNVFCANNGRVLIFDIDEITYGNFYLPSGTDGTTRNLREDYFAKIIPTL